MTVKLFWWISNLYESPVNQMWNFAGISWDNETPGFSSPHNGASAPSIRMAWTLQSTKEIISTTFSGDLLISGPFVIHNRSDGFHPSGQVLFISVCVTRVHRKKTCQVSLSRVFKEHMRCFVSFRRKPGVHCLWSGHERVRSQMEPSLVRSQMEQCSDVTGEIAEAGLPRSDVSSIT